MTDTASDSAVVEQAKGVLMLRYGVGSYESLAALARWAHEAHVTLHEIAHALVKGICQGHVTADTQGMVRWLEHRLRADIHEAVRAAGEVVRPRDPAAGEVLLPRDPGAADATTPVRRPRATVATRGPAPQWRYSSAVHAARSLGRA